GINAPKGISGEIPRPPIRLAANCLWFMPGCWRSPSFAKLNLPGGKFEVSYFGVGVGIFFLAEKCCSLVLWPLARPSGFVVEC
ncbi:hypothetical protein, partial [Streptomyces europaeiscabiei]|uniref:hypothetical protein n=1 Tax=Streptomyces europaeiscabiei TaxID=146819 RepID=UPI00299FD4EA